MTYNTRPATAGDALYVAKHLRRSDAQEVRASHGYTPSEALGMSFESSDVCRVLTADAVPLCIYGTCFACRGAASVWLLGTDQIRQHRKAFMAVTASELQILHHNYPVLFNYVDERNTASIAWLKWAGAKFIQRHPRYGVAGIPFLEFVHVQE